MAISGPQSGDDPSAEGGIFAEINITPLTDIFLVLLIIFMVTSSVMAKADAARSGMKVNLPHGASKDISAGKTDVTVGIDKDGNMLVDGKQVAVDTLRAIFDEAKAKDAEAQVIVQADENAHHGRVVAVMELAKAAGLHRLAIATRHGK